VPLGQQHLLPTPLPDGADRLLLLGKSSCSAVGSAPQSRRSFPAPSPHTFKEMVAAEGLRLCWETQRLPGALAAALAVPVAGRARHGQSPGTAGDLRRQQLCPGPGVPWLHRLHLLSGPLPRSSFQMATANAGQVLGSNLPAGLPSIVLAGTDPGEGTAAAPYQGFSPKLGKAAGFLWKRLPLSPNSYVWGIGNDSLGV